MKLRGTLTLLVLLCCFLGCRKQSGIASVPAGPPAAVPATFKAHAIGDHAQIQSPPDWMEEPPGAAGQLMLAAPSTPGASERIIFRARELPLPGHTTAEAIADATIPQLKGSYSNFNLISRESTKLGALDAVRLIYAATSKDGNEVQWMQTWAVSGSTAWILTWTAPRKLFPESVHTFQEMEASFRPGADSK